MRGWLERRWKSIEGRVLWIPTAALFAYLGSFLPMQAVTLWFHHPVTNIGAGLWSCFPVVVVVMLFVIRDSRTPQLKIEVRPTAGPSPEVFLAITNLGATTTLSAFCEVVGHPNGVNDYRAGEVRVGWDGGAERQLLHQGETANLLIASFEEVVKFDLLQLNLWQVVNGKPVIWNSARWNQHPNEVLPAFDLKVRVVGEGTKAPETLAFTVRPQRFTGPLELLQKTP